MANRIRKADYFSMQVSNRVGEGMRLLKGLRDNGVNLLAFTGFPNGRKAQVDFIPENTAALRRAAKKMKLNLGKKKTVFLMQGDDRVGALAGEIAGQLAVGRLILKLHLIPGLLGGFDGVGFYFGFVNLGFRGFKVDGYGV